MANEPESELAAIAKADLAELREAVRRRYEHLTLDRELIAKGRQVVMDSERRLKGLREPEDGEDENGKDE